MTPAAQAFPEWIGDWTPTTEQRTAVIESHPLTGLAAMLGVAADQAAPGRPLPMCWHWVALSQWPAEETVAADGHPRTGAFLPAMPYPRRVWAGAEIDSHHELLIGQPVTVTRSVTAVTDKPGTHGSFALATVTTVVDVDGDPAMTEHVRLAYLPDRSRPGDQLAAPPPVQPRGSSWLRRRDAWDWQIQPDPVVLMWFSALTANPHRIHYDRPYATQAEGHPDLLVHGPLMALALAEVARRERPHHSVRGFSCRASRPLAVGTAAGTRLREAPDDSDAIQLELAPDRAGPGDPAYLTAAVRYL